MNGYNEIYLYKLCNCFIDIRLNKRNQNIDEGNNATKGYNIC